MDWGMLFVWIVTNLILAVFSYLLVPTIIVLLRKKYSVKKIRKIIIINCVIVWILFRILEIESGNDPSMGGAVFLWGALGYLILRKYCLEKDQSTVSQISPTTNMQAPSVSVKSVEFRAAVAGDKESNYEVINNTLASGFVDNARKIIKEQITKAITEYGLTRKTDLMKVIFGYVSQEFSNAKGPKTDLVVSAYYQIAFDEIVTQCGDMDELIFNYSASKVSGIISKDIHRYLQMMVKIQKIIDDAIVSNQACDTYRGYSMQLQAKVFNELNSYIDDTTDWNKL